MRPTLVGCAAFALRRFRLPALNWADQPAIIAIIVMRATRGVFLRNVATKNNRKIRATYFQKEIL
jgi:hypothetical protein